MENTKPVNKKKMKPVLRRYPGQNLIILALVSPYKILASYLVDVLGMPERVFLFISENDHFHIFRVFSKVPSPNLIIFCVVIGGGMLLILNVLTRGVPFSKIF